MTCIVGVVDGGRVHMGCDDQVTWSNSNSVIRQKISTPKIRSFFKDSLLLGYAGNPRGWQLLCPWLELAEGEDDVVHSLEVLADQLRGVFEDGGFLGASGEGTAEFEGTMLAGWRGGLYRITSEFVVLELSSEFAAVGTGEQFAVGALELWYLRFREQVHPKVMVAEAIAISHVYEATVGHPHPEVLTGGMV